MKGITSRSIVAKEVGISPSHISRYIRLTELIPELLQMVDNKRLSLAAAAELSYLDDQLQGWTNEYINDFGMVKQEQLMFLRDCREGYNFSHDDFLYLMKSIWQKSWSAYVCFLTDGNGGKMELRECLMQAGAVAEQAQR